MGGGFNRPNIGQNVGDMPEGFTSGPGGRAMTQWYNKNTDQFWDAPSTGYTPGEGSGWVLSDSFDPYENTISDGRPQLKGIGGNSGNGYSSNPIFNGLDMSGFKPPGISTMDVATYTLNGEEHTGSGTYVSALEKYLKSTGQESDFSRPDNTYISSDIGSVNTAPTPEPTQAEKDAKYLDYTQEQLKANAGKSGYTEDGRFVGKYGFVKDPTALPGAPIKDYYNEASGESFSGAGWTVPEAMQVGNWFEVGKKPDDWQEQTKLSDGNWYGADNLQENADRLYSEQYPDSKTAAEYRAKYTPEPTPDFNMSPAVLPTENINPFADIPMWQGFPTQQQPAYTQPTYTQPTSDGTTAGMPNLGYASSQLAGTSPAGLEKQNLDYAMAQLGMMTGGYGRGYTQPGDFGTPTNPQAGVTYGGGDGETGNFGSSSDNYRSPQDYQDYLTGDRSFLQGALGLFGPLGTGLGIATDYDMGFSTLSPNTGENLGYTNPFTDEYSAFYNENYAGPGSDMAFTQDLMYPTEQRDMLINQQSFDILPEQTEESFTDWLGGMFGGNTLNYDPDMDLERSDWSDTTPAAPGSFDNRLQGPWSGTDTYKNSLEGYANAEQINKDFNEMLNWEDTDPQSVQEFTKMFSSLNNLTEAEFNKLALEGLKKDEEKKIADVLAKEQTRQEAITDIKSSLSNLGSVMTEQKEWTATQFEDYQGAMDFQIDNIKETLSSQLSLNEAQRSILRDAMMEMTSNSVQSINAQLMSISDTNSKQYNDLLSKLETVEGDLTQQIEDAYTGPNTGYNPITDTAPDTGGTSPEDLGGTSTTDEDAFAEIDSGYDDPSESSGPSDSGSSDSGQHDSSGGSISNDSFDNDDDAGGWSW